ncbi:glycosyltransferase family 4 protein [Treponema sp. OMZ 792]|uniref:glycosyltransferase family 4 protein n=1 Tax=unclassified Treponema TaxID=2638727 RepID=UPI0020A3B831|nr:MULTISPECIES: glycosyltransferase family 1 protein [unclassified Treponema]UTC76177.1 glycosyltransferase family 4 protein [Treponema sp. OMZ 792]UTC77946.1 glycosyltransferase family 4 protein [Treponema sp. OMZ 799]UTC80179.1 glycosyltransferase family 4 protein [Treponema sp. OMZ 798]
MKIGVDAFGCDHGRSGIGSYILSLVKNLPKNDYEFELFGPELDKYTYTSDIDYVSFTGIDISDTKFSEKIWHFKNLNSFIKKQRYDAVIYPAGVDLLPPSFTVPSILVIQGLLSADLGPIAKMGLKRTLKNASGLISPTKYIQNDLAQFGVKSSDIKVIYNGIDGSLFKPITNDEDRVLIQPFAIQRPYIIYASRMTHAEKCHVELIKAFALFKKQTGSPHRLVIAGSDGDNSEAVHNAVIQSGFSSDILLTGYFPHESLPPLYSSADLCVFPSMIEGVGLPVIEAMACGVPVACARAGALPEIAGDSALFFNSKKPEEIAEAISSLIDCDKNAVKRKEMIDKGFEWVKQYNWETTAHQTIEYIDSLLKK